MNEFETLGLSQPVVDAVAALGFSEPTPIQSKAIPRLLEGDTDMVGLAQTGTGKTAAFGLPLVDLVEVEEPFTQGLVLAPTRELCVQIAKDMDTFAKFKKRLSIKAVYGGTDIGRQIREVKKGAHILVATPGRLRDLMRRKAVRLGELKYVVLDEADEMLNMGFKEEIDDILKDTPADKQTWLFSATMPSEVRRISNAYMTDPFELSVGTKNATNEDIDHQYVFARPSEKYDILKRFLDFDTDTFGLIFCRTRMGTAELADRLMGDGYLADALHGDMSQNQRDRVMGKFRSRRLQLLVATDVAARGIDVDDITHVFHFNIPEDISYYTHRSGRTGRAGKKGISLVLAHPKDLPTIKKLEYITKAKFTMTHIPTGKEICKQRLMSQINSIKEVEVNEEIEEYLPGINEALEELSREELIKRLSALSFNDLINKYQTAPDFNPKSRKKFRGKRLFINLGRMDIDGIGPFLGLVCEHCGIPGSSIGRVDMQKKYTFFDVEEAVAPLVVKKFKNATYQGRALRVNEDGGRRRDKDRGNRRGNDRRRDRDKRKGDFKGKRSGANGSFKRRNKKV